MPKTVIVTGAARGIGRGLAQGCAQNGWQVVAIDNDEAALAEAFSDENITILPGSVAVDGIDDLIKKLENLNMTFSGVINNAAIDSRNALPDLTSDDLINTYANNVAGPFELTRWWANRLTEHNNGGSAIFITSLHDQKVCFHIDYSLSKAALSQLIRELAAEFAPHKIRVNGLRPGAIDTWTKNGNKDERTKQSERLVPLERLGSVQDLVEACLFLLDDKKSGYMTGQQITIDGGLDLYNWLGALDSDTK